MNYEERDRMERAARVALAGICGDLAAALTAESGEAWAGEVNALRGDWREELRGPERTESLTLTRARDGFTVSIRAGTWNECGKASAEIAWPKNPADGWPVKMRDAPGSWGASEPGFGFTVEKAKPATLARRILRELTGEDRDSAWAAFVARWAAEGEARDAAACWRDAVAGASGCNFSVRDSAVYWFGQGGFSELESQRDSPGGKLTVRLPIDPGEAAATVAAILALIKGESV